ncbi:hypothetical protein [Tahibacter amnicola]|uniref:Uncharacterized protein n=1 Tax=Tahibacter amnicola TaxID=2976241 RepID=A0ABY6BN99_9GAMM|nr:hypothetical protein [Tahibacter amnicola]UXI70535.1 hypothetical protein N4264_13115 [Tahibacter amnicola]
MYYRTIPTDRTVDEISNLIIGEEAGGSQFVENKVSVLKESSEDRSNTLKNLAKFLELDDSIPARPVVILAGADKPQGKSLVWNGVMLVQGVMKVVEIYR